MDKTSPESNEEGSESIEVHEIGEQPLKGNALFEMFEREGLTDEERYDFLVGQISIIARRDLKS